MASSATASEQQSESITTRYTKDGRKISYRLKVVQQPERARACGQGAKSSSDRRPVDPPPIVELRILEGDQDTDITFPYNASFFLFATLEPARPIAQPRGSHTQANNAVLTGAPAVGISYLDRPHPAGYFIFPDLSVRHEGQYKLNFALFEAMKEPQDADANAPNSENVGSYYHNRCEVKSAAFHVYSAKKFPGLTESTLLSRVVADQGCRVRIRRDVRMRRRDSKAEKDWEEAEEAPAVEGARNDLTSSTYETKPLPSPQQQEQNEPVQKFESAPSSTSTQTIQAPPQPNQAVQQPMQAGFSYPQWYQYPPTTQQNNQQMYAPHTPAEQTYVQQQQYQTQYSPTQAQPMNQVTQYPSAYGYQPNTPNPMVQNGAMSYQAQPQQQMPSMHGQQQQDYSQQSQMRPQTAMYSPIYNTDNQQQYAYQQQSMAYQQQQQQQQAQTNHQQMSQQQQLDANGTAQTPNVPLAIGKPLPPLEVPRVSHTTAPDAVVSPINATAAGRQPGGSSNMGPSPNNQAQYSNSLYAGGMNTMSRPPPPQFVSSAGLGQKRSYGASFNTLHTQGSMQNGARPNTELAPEWSDAASEEDVQDLESISMEYRRADGSYTVVQPRQFRMS